MGWPAARLQIASAFYVGQLQHRQIFLMFCFSSFLPTNLIARRIRYTFASTVTNQSFLNAKITLNNIELSFPCLLSSLRVFVFYLDIIEKLFP